jgi:hypothetical protein
VILPVVSYTLGFITTFVAVVVVLTCIFVASFITGYWTKEDVLPALEVASQDYLFVMFFGVCRYLVISARTLWSIIHEVPWGQRLICVHAHQCKYQDRERNLLAVLELERGKVVQHIIDSRDLVARHNIEREDLQVRLQESERERANYQYVAELPRINNGSFNCAKCSGLPLLAPPDFSVALEDARSRIGGLLMEADNAKAARLTEIASYKTMIDKLNAQINYSGSAGRDRSQTRTELEHAKSTNRFLERSLREITFTASELRQSLARERETHSEKCQNQAVCTRKILQLQVERDQFKHYQHESDLFARQSAKAIRGLRDSDVAHITIRSYLAEMTTKFLEFQARGTPGLSTTDLQVDIVHRNYAEQMAIKDRLEREVDRLGGDADAIRMGRDTTRPQDWRVDTLTFEQNHDRVFPIYEELAQIVINLEQLLMAHVPSAVPIWHTESARNDATKWLEDAPPSEMQLFKHYATINQIINPTSPHESALREKLMVRECQRWYNRGSQLLSIFIRVSNDAHTTQIITSEQANHIKGVLSRADRVLKATFYGVLMETCMLKRDDTERQPSAREKKRFKVYTAMQHSITALTNSIRENQRMSPPWPKLPSPKNAPIERADDLATHLVVQEMITLESRIRQLRKFMEDYQMPGTINGPVQTQIQGDNGRYSNLWTACVAALTYSDFTLSHWLIWKAHKPVQKIGDDGLPVFNDRREPVFVATPEIESKLVPLITWDDFIISIKLKNAEIKQEDPDKFPEGLVPVSYLDPQLGPLFRFVPKSEVNKEKNNGGKDNKPQADKAGKDDSNGNSVDAKKKIAGRREYDKFGRRIQQLANHCRDWAIKSHMPMPQTKQLAKNASLETITKAIAAQNQSIQLWSGLIIGSGRKCPKWPEAGGPMKPKLG